MPYLGQHNSHKAEKAVTPTIIILAMIAAFLGFRLYSVLGKRTGHEQEPVLPRAEDRAPAAPAASNAPATDQARPGAPAAVPGFVYEAAAEPGIRALLAAERGFDVARFLNGAKAAYRLILEAYWAGDRAALRDLCDADSFAAFDAAITAREDRGERFENRLVSIERAIIADASVRGADAQIVVRFDADIVSITRDADDRIIAGSMTDATQTQDVWSFRRTIGSRDPNWLLDETDAG